MLQKKGGSGGGKEALPKTSGESGRCVETRQEEVQRRARTSAGATIEQGRGSAKKLGDSAGKEQQHWGGREFSTKRRKSSVRRGERAER